ncbi:MAG: pyrroline-5-carboxylate reductase dimerization domain-containing protein [Pseudomonadota bacterium]
MSDVLPRTGIIGGSGMLGGAIARALLRAKALKPQDLWISNRSGSNKGFEDWPEINVTTNNQDVADACEIVLLCIPPSQVDHMNLKAPDRLVLSVMAGVKAREITEITGATRVVRAMSNPAAEDGLAYSPWYARADLSKSDYNNVVRFFSACGETDQVPHEHLIDSFTALTGPVPGFVAYFADCMVAYAVEKGTPPEIAERAVRQLFLASGQTMAQSKVAPARHVQDMIEYAGTTAAGLLSMGSSEICDSIWQGLDAAGAAAGRMRK